MAKQEKYIQVGVTAMRDPATGEFLPAVPLYIKADPQIWPRQTDADRAHPRGRQGCDGA